MDGMNQNSNNPYGQQNDAYQVNNLNQQNNAYQASDSYQQNNAYQTSDPYHHNPYQPQDNSDMQMTYPYNAPENKKGNGAKIAVGIACALVALIGIGVGVLAYHRSTPSYRISKGFQNLGKEIVQTRNPLADKIGMSDILLMMQEEGSHVETKLNFSVDMPLLGKTTMGVDTDLYRDVHAKELSADTNFSMMNWDFAHLNIYANDEVFCFSMPELFLEDLYIENENVISQYNHSIFGDAYPSDIEDFSINLFPDANESVSMRDLSNLSTALENFQDDFNALRDGMTIGKVEKGLYRVTLPAKETDRLLKNLMENSANMYGEEELLRELKTYKNLMASDVSLLLEIDGKNRIESILLESPIEMFDGEASLEGELFFLGEARSIDKIQGKITVNSVYGLSIGALWQIQQTSDDDIYRVETDLKWTEEKETIGKMKFVVNCDAVKDEFDLTFSMQDEVDALEFILESSIDDIVKGESLEIDLDKMVVSMDGEERIDVTGNVSIEPLTEAVKSSAEPKTALFEMTEADWLDILYQLDDEYGAILNSLVDYLL